MVTKHDDDFLTAMITEEKPSPDEYQCILMNTWVVFSSKQPNNNFSRLHLNTLLEFVFYAN